MTALSTRSLVAPLRILLIEDDEGDRDLALEYLEEDNRRLYITSWACSLEEGIERLKHGQFDVVILDLVLPDSKGVTTVSKLCAQSNGVPVIVSSYFDEDALASKVIELGAQDYLAKDLMNSQRLGRIINRALARAKHQANLLAQHRVSQPNAPVLAPPTDPLSEKIKKLQADIQRLESVANHVTQGYEQQQNISDVRQQMIKTLSHECRSPATVILLATNILKSYTTNVEDEQYLTAISRIDEAVKQMMKLLDNAMSFKQVQAIATETFAENTNLEAVCQAIINQISDAHKPRFHTTYEGDCQNVTICRTVVEQILFQLITNAAQYSLPLTPVTITLQNDIDQLIIDIKDSGQGIHPDEQSQVFEAFYRSERLSEHLTDTHGIGLGLTIVKTCVDICGGQITLDSQLEQGTTVTVSLPLE
ncbi:MAG: ATP-binding protein [Phormidesmis sp.]